MASLDRHLVRRDIGIVLLLDPPFDMGTLDPGYIKGYVPGFVKTGPVHPRRRVGEHGVRPPGRRRPRLGTDAHDQPPEPGPCHPHRHLQGGALRDGGGCLRCGAPCRARRLELVHRCGRMDVPADRRIAAGVERQGNTLLLQPLLPPEWSGFSLQYRYGASVYHIDVHHGTQAVQVLSLDGGVIDGTSLSLVDDGAEHQVTLLCAASATATLPLLKGT